MSASDHVRPASGPLAGTKIIELAGIGPGPFAAMLLADMGADVIRIDRSASAYGGDPENPPADVLNRGRRSIAVDLKNPEGRETILALVEQADALIEGFRPGVTERLGLGPDDCWARNPKLVYGRMTGWGQTGPYSQAAGHDINYIALTGALGAIRREGERPMPPLNLVGDFGGGAMFLAFGVACGLFEAARSGKGQVVDTAMVDGASVLTTMFWAFRAMGFYNEAEPGTNLLDTGAHFYETYETSDGLYVSLGAIEPQFYATFVKLTGYEADIADAPSQMNQSSWRPRKESMAALFKTKTRAEWCDILEHTDACFAPVLSFTEAAAHPHNVARGTFTDFAGITQPAPAPRFSRTPAGIQRPPAHAGQHTDEILADWLGKDGDAIAALRTAGAVAG